MSSERTVEARGEWGETLAGGRRRLDSTQPRRRFTPELAPKWASGGVVVTARRGFSAAYPENTMLAFAKAAELETDVLMVDVRGTRDHVPIVLHDATLDRTTDALGAPDEYLAVELRGVNASHWVGGADDGHRLDEPAYPRLPLPTLEEVVDTLAHRAGFCCCLHELEEPLVKAVCRLFETYDLYEQAYVLVGGWRQAKQVRAADGEVAIAVREPPGALTAARLAEHAAAGYRVVHVEPGEISPGWLEAAAGLGIRVNVEPVNDLGMLQGLLGAGVRGIVTDRPDLVLAAAAELNLG